MNLRIASPKHRKNHPRLYLASARHIFIPAVSGYLKTTTMSPSQNKDILVGIVGVGLVGGELVKQILSINKAKNPFRIVLLASSRKALYTSPENAITDSESWKATLNASEESAELTKFGDYLAGLVAQGKGRKAVIVDNTSSEDVARLYPKWIAQGLNVATPNKKAFSGEKKTWDAILAASDSEGGGRWLNESTVGAGLPVINTLKEMLGSGDRVKKIEGVFSGTMSYIFNNFSAASSDAPKPAFSEVVKVAREKGYTEPHPADDLNGFDVARKLTILARTVSAFSHSQTKLPELESFLDVQTQSLIPAPLEGVASGDEFVGKLPAFDEEFNKLREEAAKEGQVLRFVGVVDVEAGVVKAGLEKYPVTHPFATSLGGSDNIIMFHTERYSPRPLIVQGAGAGAAVTAMGVLGDLLKLV